MTRALAPALLAAACAAAPTAPPPPPAEPWCVQLERFLGEALRGEGDFSCESVAGLVLGARAEPGSSRPRSLESCSAVRVRTRALPGGAAFASKGGAVDVAAAPWLARAVGNRREDVVVELRDVVLRELDDLPNALAEAATKDACKSERAAICHAEAAVVDAVIEARPLVRVGGSEQRLERPVVIAARSATPGVLLGNRAACRGTGGRPPTAAEKSAFRDFASELGYAFLRTVQCQMLELSPPMLNTLCAGKPCTTMRLLYDVYRHPLSELQDAQRQAVCAAIEAHPGFAACGASSGERGAFVCNALAPFLRDNGALPWCEIGLSGCSDGMLAGKHVPTQISIFSHVLAAATPAQRECLLDRLLATWKGYEARPFEAAAASFAELVTRCEPAGCNFGPVSTEQRYALVERALLARFFEHFSRPGSIDVNPGCSSVWLSFDKTWAVTRGGSGGFGLSPAAPETLRGAALAFADRLVGKPSHAVANP